MKRKYGYIPDVADSRDHLLRESMFAAVHLPESVDLRTKGHPAIKDQGPLGSCTANALTFGLEFLMQQDHSMSVLPLSRLFLYYNERSMEGTVQSDNGAMIRDGIKSLNTLGCCVETDWPYLVQRFAVRPPPNAYADAKQELLTEYLRVNDAIDMQTALANGFPVVIGISIYESFESTAVASSGKVALPEPDERLLGGHAVCVLGYDQHQFIVANSWGEGWGDKGFFYLPHDYIDLYASDCWALQKEV